MAESRIHIDKDKTDFVKSLLAENDKGLFSSMADVLAFSASLGLANNRSIKVREKSLRNPDPIRYSIFQNSGYDTLINLLAIWEENDANVLAQSDEMDIHRITIFEEYANGGLEILKAKLNGCPDFTQEIMLLIAEQQKKQQSSKDSIREEDDIDLTQYTL